MRLSTLSSLLVLVCGASLAGGQSPAPKPTDPKDPVVACEACDSVGMEVLQGIPHLKWDFVSPPPSEFYLESSFAWTGYPKRFAPTGEGKTKEAQTPAAGFVLRGIASVVVPPGEHRFLIRSSGPARFFIDETLVAETKAPAANEPAPKPLEEPGLRPLPAGQWERVVKVRLAPRVRSETPNAHTFKLVGFVAGDNRPEASEWCVAIAGAGESFRLLSPKQNVPLTADGWKAAAAKSRAAVEVADREYEAEQREKAQ